MERDGFAFLTAQLREEPPAGVTHLEEQHLHHLAGAIRGARHRQAEQLSAASEAALGKLPRMLRGPVKKIVG